MKKFILCFIILRISCLSAQSVDVPLDYWGYDFLDRCQTKGLVKKYFFSTKPFSRQTFSKIIKQILVKTNKSPENFTSVDRAKIKLLVQDFSDELQSGLNSSEVHIFQLKENQNSLYLDIYGEETIISNRGAQYDPNQLLSETMLGGIVRGKLHNKIGFLMDARNALIRGQENVQDSDENFDVSKGSPVVVSGSNIFKDRAIAYATFGLPKLQFQLGRNEINWGPGVRGSLAISKNMPATDMIRFRVNFQNLQFTSIHAFLSNPLGAKYLAAHRLDIAIFPSIHIGATETVVYGQRDIELAYINPIMPYHIAEHHLGDQDNNNLSFDVTLTAFSSVKLYGEYFIDDMTSTQNLLKYYGNKFAFLFGLHWVDPLSFDNMGLRCEYTRIEPFVYSHRDSINIYTHYDKTIGHWLGPNADNLYLQLTYQATRDLEIECFGERIRNGKGTASTFSEPVYGSRKYFLGGIVEKQYLLGLSISNQIRKDIFVTLSYTYSDTRNLFLQKNLNSYDHLARFKLYFNY